MNRVSTSCDRQSPTETMSGEDDYDERRNVNENVFDGWHRIENVIAKSYEVLARYGMLCYAIKVISRIGRLIS